MAEATERAPVAILPVRPEMRKPKPEPLPAVVEPPREKAKTCLPRDRAPAGWTRYRIRAEIPGGNHPARYLLAKTKGDAEAEYIQTNGLDATAKMQVNGRPALKLITVTLPD